MRYKLISDLISLVEDYDKECPADISDLSSFISWLNKSQQRWEDKSLMEPEWKGKSDGRSADSVINTSLVHLYRYAKLQAKQVEYIYTFAILSLI